DTGSGPPRETDRRGPRRRAALGVAQRTHRADACGVGCRRAELAGAMMRLLIVNVHFDPESFGGATIVAEETASHLAADGHEVFVMTGITEPRLAHGEFHRYEARSLPVVALGRSAPHSPDQDY